MATVIHILLSDLPVTRSVRDRISIADEIVFEAEGESFRFTRVNNGPGRTAAEALHIMSSLPGGNVMVDDEWSSDMREIMRQNRSHDRDPWND